MKATSLLEKQHRKVQAALKKLEAGKVDPGPLLMEIANDLAAHMTIEQEIFYPAALEADETMVLESFEEHAIAELALKRLLATDPADRTFHAKTIVLTELINNHIEEEEQDLFPNVEKALGQERLESLGKEMKKAFEAAIEKGFQAALPKGSRTSADAAERKALASNGHSR
ncbi:MAG: hemerythrin domain-containing protein [Polyangiaceae bacterium]